ncbi:hypothetical protein MIU24_01520 [Streptomyces venezuelae]
MRPPPHRRRLPPHRPGAHLRRQTAPAGAGHPHPPPRGGPGRASGHRPGAVAGRRLNRVTVAAGKSGRPALSPVGTVGPDEIET